MSKRSSPQFQLYCDDCMCTFVRVRRIIIGIGVLGSVSQSFSQSGSQPSSHSVTVAIYSFDPVSNSIGLPHPPLIPSPSHIHIACIQYMGFGERGVYLLATIHWSVPLGVLLLLLLISIYSMYHYVDCVLSSRRVSWMAFYPQTNDSRNQQPLDMDARTKSVCVCCNCNITVCVIHSSLNLLLNCILLLFATYGCVGDRLHFLLLPPPTRPLYLSLALYCLSSFRSLSIRFVWEICSVADQVVHLPT